jgi:type III pantothenate kinase
MTYALVDIGNTAIKAMIYGRDHTRESVVTVGNDDESLALFFKQLSLERILVSSVVPSIDQKIRLLKLSHIIFLTHDHFTDLRIHVEPSTSVGIDRLVNAVAVTHKWNANVVVIDIGTCITFCRIKKEGDYLGGVIMPGFKMVRNALYYEAEQLPLIDFPDASPDIIGHTTEAAMSSGVFYGAIDMINGMIHRLKKDDDKLSVVLTGGAPTSLLERVNYDVIELTLQFDGLEILYKKLMMSS